MQQNKIINIPNILSFYRLVSFPFVLYLVLSGREELFAWLICINLVTDVLDGWIARAFHMQTALGARLDSLADIGTFILSLSGIYRFKINEIGSDVWLLWLAVLLYLMGYVISFIKFRQYQSFHLYSSKISGYAMGAFFFVLFMFSYQPLLFFISMSIGMFSFLEEISILLLIKELQSDVKGLLWVLRKK